ncbi:hypothetical protein [Desulfosporosinus nitroreducens]|uniref:Uncharacterized protein n=1 Tax=Desulfosporosinus nitroreducens TaxID=2018668 RepID=A0ABT8QMU4_9FIRM|nr:hypothetical protein [Desulfosporosinus nitroreducens]MDO0821939.1 hypothetical protein [Desulfosporosinus nitroreducens]
MDQETREMFGKVLGVLEVIKTDVSSLKSDVSILKTDVSILKTDVSILKTDVSILKTDVSGLKTDVSGLKTDVSDLKTDVSDLRTDVGSLKTDMNVMRSRQDEMYLMLKGSEESRQRIKSLEEKSTIAAIERENLEVESAKIVGALRRSAHEVLKGLADEEVS